SGGGRSVYSSSWQDVTTDSQRGRGCRKPRRRRCRSQRERRMSVAEFLTDHQVPFETIYDAPAFTAQKRAKYLHTPGKQVAKCVLLVGQSGYILAVLPATRQIDLERLNDQLAEKVRIAEDQEITWVFRDCEWGVVSPFGTLYG